MRRGYTSRYFRKRVEAIAGILGNIGLGTDVIVGFPGETDSDFNETRQIIENLPFTYLHIFPYSPRPNTDAAKMTGRPADDVVRERTYLLRWLGNEKKRKYMENHIGKHIEIIIEEGLSHGAVVGTSSNYLKISVPAYDHRRGSIEIARPVRLTNDILEGVLIKDP
jgi:threonylcarbamoyladenosine tRNA methylthiotransferase MtaB